MFVVVVMCVGFHGNINRAEQSSVTEYYRIVLLFHFKISFNESITIVSIFKIRVRALRKIFEPCERTPGKFLSSDRKK